MSKSIITTPQASHSSLEENFTPVGRQIYQLVLSSKKLLAGKSTAQIQGLLSSLLLLSQGKPKTTDLLNDLQEFFRSLQSIELLTAPLSSEQAKQFFHIAYVFGDSLQPFVEIVQEFEYPEISETYKKLGL